MNEEVNQSIDQLLDPESSRAQRQSALQHLGEVLEEDYILNLPPQRPILKALESLARRATVEAAVKAKAKKLMKEYGL
jgi:hypothetical protein